MREQSRVLFVDDEKPILNAMRRLFRREPYEMEFAPDAETALKVVEDFHPAVVVSDQRMPGMSGIDLLSRVKEFEPDTVRIVLTGYTDLRVAEDAINRGEVYRFITKPWNDDDLRSAVASGVERYQLKKENEDLLKQLKELNSSLEEKVAERTRELEQRQAELVQSEKLAAVGMLAGGVAHEINNPLGGILALTQILRREAEGGTQAASQPAVWSDTAPEDLRQIEEAALRCKRIVSDLLDFSRSSKAEERQEVYVEDLFEKALSLAQLQDKRHHVTVERSFEDGVPGVRVNANRIQQVLLNLLSNAFYAAHEASGDDAAVTLRTSAENGYVVASVEDNGPGVPDKYTARVFDPFFTTKTPGQGTGLGLSVSYGIVQEHGGRIEVENTSRGARFRVYLPTRGD